MISGIVINIGNPALIIASGMNPETLENKAALLVTLAVALIYGVKKELDVLVKVLSAHHNGVVVVLSSDQLHVLTDTNFHKKFVALH